MLSQFLRGDREGMKSAISDNVERARRARARMERKWEAAPAASARETAKAERWRQDSLKAPKIARESDAQLIEHRDAVLCASKRGSSAFVLCSNQESE